MNKLVRNHRVFKDMVRFRLEELEQIIVDHVKEKTGVEIQVSVDRDDDSETGMNIMIINEDELLNEDRELLDQHLYDYDDHIHFADVVMQELNDGKDCWWDYGGRNDHTGEVYIDVYIDPYQDIMPMLHVSLDHALNGTREDVISSINDIIKYCKERGRKK